jgi:D-alanine-D-alanine ligase
VTRLRVGVVYGGRSGEHEVSIASAAAVLANLDRERYDAIPLYIDRAGRWTIADRPPTSASAAEAITQARRPPSRDRHQMREVHLLPRPGGDTLLVLAGEEATEHTTAATRALVTGLQLDVVFPVLHGPYGEDGTVQGLLELAGVAYVGAGVVASAVSMDKAVAKAVFAANGLPMADHMLVTQRRWAEDRDATIQAVLDRFALPVFVKPANLGSSVGISKARHAVELRAAITLAAEFDRKVIVEAAVPNAREIECSVLGNDEPEASVPGEIVPSREFYDYEAKYIDNGSVPLIPAPITEAQTAEVRSRAIAAFKAIDGAGMARVDFLLARDSGVLYVNEVNTIPGFTTIGMFAKMWAASGVDFPHLVDRLIALALERHRDKQQLRTSM